MSPNGTLLAYSKPVDIKELRDQAALISIAWKEHCQGRKPPPVPDSRKDSSRDEASAAASGSHTLKSALKILTIESQDCNILVRLLQPELLLILIGKIPPNKTRNFRIHAEAYGDPRYPPFDFSASHPSSSSNGPQGDASIENLASKVPEGLLKGKAPSLLSNMSQREKDIRLGPLHVQRKRLDALADYILKDFGTTGFVMPADSDLQ
jgi:hypothetical protein